MPSGRVEVNRSPLRIADCGLQIADCEKPEHTSRLLNDAE
jgi:hypothetical protein